MIPIKFNNPPLERKDWEKVRAIAAQTVKNSMTQKMRDDYKEVVKDTEPENCFGAFILKVGEEQKEIFVTTVHHADVLPEEIRDFLAMCFAGSHEYYCKSIGMI